MKSEMMDIEKRANKINSELKIVEAQISDAKDMAQKERVSNCILTIVAMIVQYLIFAAIGYVAYRLFFGDSNLVDTLFHKIVDILFHRNWSAVEDASWYADFDIEWVRSLACFAVVCARWLCCFAMWGMVIFSIVRVLQHIYHSILQFGIAGIGAGLKKLFFIPKIRRNNNLERLLIIEKELRYLKRDSFDVEVFDYNDKLVLNVNGVSFERLIDALDEIYQRDYPDLVAIDRNLHMWYNSKHYTTTRVQESYVEEMYILMGHINVIKVFRINYKR